MVDIKERMCPTQIDYNTMGVDNVFRVGTALKDLWEACKACQYILGGSGGMTTPPPPHPPGMFEILGSLRWLLMIMFRHF